MRRDPDYLLDMACACRNILDWTKDLEPRSFYSDIRLQSAVQHEFMILGEATKRLSPELRAEHPAVEWKEIAGMRDRLIHGYFQVDLSVVWEGVQNEVPALLAALKPLISPTAD